jgi:Zn-dependent peptidase ImmA (M78 family)
MVDYASAIRKAALEASRLHLELGIGPEGLEGTGRIDVYDAIARLGVPLLFTKLDGLLGAYYRDPSAGILVTTERVLSQQRFTAAHELGHHYLGHAPSLDDESILRRAPFEAASGDKLQEVEAEAFGASFLFPRWLLDWQCERQAWTDADLYDPAFVYQLALRVGTSYEAAVWTLFRYKVFDRKTAEDLAAREVKKIKQGLLHGYKPENYKGDVWLVTERDADRRLAGGPQDLFVVRLQEHSGSGYLWRVESIDGEALAIVADGRDDVDQEGVGGPTIRRITVAGRKGTAGELRLAECRPWQPTKPLSTFALQYDLSGAEHQGWFKDQRHQHRVALG